MGEPRRRRSVSRQDKILGRSRIGGGSFGDPIVAAGQRFRGMGPASPLKLRSLPIASTTGQNSQDFRRQKPVNVTGAPPRRPTHRRHRCPCWHMPQQVKNALREARRLNLVTVQERRRRGQKSPTDSANPSLRRDPGKGAARVLCRLATKHESEHDISISDRARSRHQRVPAPIRGAPGKMAVSLSMILDGICPFF
jgi:hypothetical protein